MKYNPDIHHRCSIRLKDYDYSQNGAYFITICTQNRENYFGEIVNRQIVPNDAARMVEKWYYELKNKYQDIELDEFVIMPNHFHCIIQIVDENTGQNTGQNMGQTRRSAPTMGNNDECIVGANLRVHPEPDGPETMGNDNECVVGANLRVRPEPDGPETMGNNDECVVGANLRVHPEPDGPETMGNDDECVVGANLRVHPEPDGPETMGNDDECVVGANLRVHPEPDGPETMGNDDECVVGANLRVRPNVNEMIQWFKTMTTNEYIRKVKQNEWKPFNRKLWQRNYYERIIRSEEELNRIRDYIIINPLNWQTDKNNPTSIAPEKRKPYLKCGLLKS